MAQVNNYVEKMVRPAFYYYGGKSRICRDILEIAPPHKVYVEGFAGGLNVLLNKYRSDIEVVCDLNPEIINCYHVLVSSPKELAERVKATEVSKAIFQTARRAGNQGDELTRALNFLIAWRMSFAGMGMSCSITRGITNGWETLPHDLLIVARRLKGVSLLHRSAFDVIPEYDSPDTWFYLDPPYPGLTRVSTKVYNCEMNGLDHIRLLKLLKTLQGKVILSGYTHLLYDNELAEWDRVEIEIPLSCGFVKGKERDRRIEVLWIKR